MVQPYLVEGKLSAAKRIWAVQDVVRRLGLRSFKALSREERAQEVSPRHAPRMRFSIGRAACACGQGRVFGVGRGMLKV